MTASKGSAELQTGLEDVLAHLPVSSITEYRKKETIYGPGLASKGIYLVVSGKVGISQIAEDCTEVLLDIVRPEELFGESAFLAVPRRSERSTAMEATKVMTWPISEIEELVMKRPRLAVALLQVLAQRNAELTRRIESFSIDSVEQRLARTLVHFSDRLGTPGNNGAVGIMPFTHEQLSRYVGTSREIVTHYMNRFRKQGYISYSRLGIFLYRDTLKTALDKGSLGSAATTD
jgi:CRP/FNR family cyclic AMP-dependent transcriptional regulator